MARKPDIQYIHQFYVPGSEAKVLELKPQTRKAKTTLPTPKPEKKIRIQVDPVALTGLVVAVVMLALMAVGICQFSAVCEEHHALQLQVSQLNVEKAELEHAYRTGYDLEKIRETALALGMIPVSEAKTISVTVVVPEPEPEPTVWENIRWFLEGLFA